MKDSASQTESKGATSEAEEYIENIKACTDLEDEDKRR
jgi:hypothetical protein